MVLRCLEEETKNNILIQKFLQARNYRYSLYFGFDQ